MSDRETLVDVLDRRIPADARAVIFERDAEGRWIGEPGDALRARIAALAHGLRAAGIGPGDRVAIMSPNRVDWIVTNFAILTAGAVTVPLYATQAADQVAHILADSETALLFVDGPARRDALLAAGVALPRTVAFDAGDGDGIETLAALEVSGRAAAAQSASLAAIAPHVTPDDLAMLIYTSGTTGVPKGVMLSHANIASNAVAAFARAIDVLEPDAAVVSVLPFAHIYESTNVFGYLAAGLTIYVNTRIDALLDDLRAVRPAMLLGVPRIFERVLAGIIGKARAAGRPRALLVPWALAAGREYMRAKTAGSTIGAGLALRYALARAIVLDRLKPLLGLDRLRVCGSGSAPLHPDTALTYLGFGIAISEGYGLTECSPVVTVNEPLHPHIGTVGSAIAGVEVRIAGDGELLVRGPGVMKGYYHDPAATARALADGWLHTGDIATIRSDGHVRIVDRKNELFKTSGGKYIAPARIESALARSLFFNHVLVAGAGRPHPVALIAPNWETVRAELGIDAAAPPAALRTDPAVRRFLEAEATRQTADLAPFERVRSVGVLPRDLTIEDGELSPTQKVKRRVVAARYAALIDAALEQPV